MAPVSLAVEGVQSRGETSDQARCEVSKPQVPIQNNAIVSAWYLYQMGSIPSIVEKKLLSAEREDPFPIEIDEKYTFSKCTTTESEVFGIQKSALEKYCKSGKRVPVEWVNEQKKALAVLMLVQKHDLGKTEIKDIPDLMNILNEQATPADLDRIINIKIDANQLTDLVRLLNEQEKILKSLSENCNTETKK